MKNTLIFDLDGTLLNTLTDLSASVNYALKENGFPTKDVDEVRKALGNGIRVLIEKSVPANTEPDRTAKVLETFKAHYLVHSLDSTLPYPGIMELLETCRLRGYRMAIVSNKLDPAVQELFARFFSSYVDIAIGEQQPKVRRKPFPDMVDLALTRLHAAKDESIYIGDSEVDLQTARNAGIDCVSVAWGFRTRPFLESIGADKIIDKPNELLVWIDSKNQK